MLLFLVNMSIFLFWLCPKCVAVAQVQHAVKRLKAFVSIGHTLSESYVRRLGRSVNDTSALRALASHIVRIDVLASSVTAMKRSFECGGIEMGDQLSSLLVRPFDCSLTYKNL